MLSTISLCPKCYKEIPANIRIEDQVWLTKTCEEHGDFTALLERSRDWFNLCKILNCPEIYPGLLVDITNECNINCKYCFHKGMKNHRPKEEILDYMKEYKHLTPFILTGGEPTMHPDLLEIVREGIKYGEVILLSNGINLCDEKYLDELCDSGLLIGNTLTIGLSFHKESNGKDMEFLELVRKRGQVVGTTLAVIDELDQIDNLLDTYRANRDVMANIRIKAATNLENESGAKNKIFTSDILNYINSMGPCEISFAKNNKVSFGNIIYDGMDIMAVSWYDVNNVDLKDIECAPWLKAKDGSLYNFVTACLKNDEHVKNNSNSI